MNMIYNSPNYCVVEFRGETDEAKDSPGGHAGYEIMDKAARREIFLGGHLADRFRADVQELIASEPTIEEVDEFLSRFDGLMQQPMVLH